jgi:hypothetical protein
MQQFTQAMAAFDGDGRGALAIEPGHFHSGEMNDLHLNLPGQA